MNDIFINEALLERQRNIAMRYRLEHSGDGEKYYTECYGCQQNEADTERLAGIAEEMGYTRTRDRAQAKLILINTCAIREHAELKALSNVGQLKKLKEADPSLLIGICGCMVQQKNRRDQILKSYPYIDFLLGTDMIYALPETVEKARRSPRRIAVINELEHDDFGTIAEGLPIRRESNFRAWVSIMYGCNNFCSYCVVPYVRGRERSRRVNDILDEVRSLAASGVKDITLLGQNVNSYRGDGGSTFAQLLKRICAIDGDFRVRFMTSHPKDCSDALIEACKDPKVAPHFHLPFQSGSDRILYLMNRHYTRDKYLERAMKIRRELPDFSMTTDVICGFPGETDEDFDMTLDIAKQVRFDMIFTFLYSPRPGTRAAAMEGQIPHEEKVRRFNLLNELQNTIAAENNANLIGTSQRVLCDSRLGTACTGRSGQNKIVSFSSPDAVPGGMYDIKIESAGPYTLGGSVL